MTLPHLRAEELNESVPMVAAIDAIEEAFASNDARAPARSHIDVDGRDLLFMPAWSQLALGVKLVTVNPDNEAHGFPLISGIYVLFSKETSRPLVTIDGAALTALRTPAVSAVATRYLARPDASRLVIFGAGVQAEGHLEAMVAVRPIRSVEIITRTPRKAQPVLERATDLGLQASLAGVEAVTRADVVCTCTTSTTPLFDGATLSPGSHVNAVGSYKPAARELDDETVRHARIVVEDRELALSETGDLSIPLAAGVIDEGTVADLGEVVGGRSIRRSDIDVTLFKSVGLAIEDLAVACAAARALGLKGNT